MTMLSAARENAFMEVLIMSIREVFHHAASVGFAQFRHLLPCFFSCMLAAAELDGAAVRVSAK